MFEWRNAGKTFVTTFVVRGSVETKRVAPEMVKL